MNLFGYLFGYLFGSSQIGLYLPFFGWMDMQIAVSQIPLLAK